MSRLWLGSMVLEHLMYLCRKQFMILVLLCSAPGRYFRGDSRSTGISPYVEYVEGRKCCEDCYSRDTKAQANFGACGESGMG